MCSIDRLLLVSVGVLMVVLYNQLVAKVDHIKLVVDSQKSTTNDVAIKGEERHRALKEAIWDLSHRFSRGLNRILAHVLPPDVIKDQTDTYLDGLLLLTTSQGTGTGFVVANSTRKFVVTVRHLIATDPSQEGTALATVCGDAPMNITVVVASEAGRGGNPASLICTLVAGGTSSVAGSNDWAVLDCTGLENMNAYKLEPTACGIPHNVGENTVSLCALLYYFHPFTPYRYLDTSPRF